MVIVILTFDPIIGAMIYQIEHIGVIYNWVISQTSNKYGELVIYIYM